jgi:hypothetical protein
MKAERVPHPADDDELIVSITATAEEWISLLEYESWESHKRIVKLLQGMGVPIS